MKRSVRSNILVLKKEIKVVIAHKSQDDTQLREKVLNTHVGGWWAKNALQIGTLAVGVEPTNATHSTMPSHLSLASYHQTWGNSYYLKSFILAYKANTAPNITNPLFISFLSCP